MIFKKAKLNTWFGLIYPSILSYEIQLKPKINVESTIIQKYLCPLPMYQSRMVDAAMASDFDFCNIRDFMRNFENLNFKTKGYFIIFWEKSINPNTLNKMILSA